MVFSFLILHCICPFSFFFLHTSAMAIIDTGLSMKSQKCLQWCIVPWHQLLKNVLQEGTRCWWHNTTFHRIHNQLHLSVSDLVYSYQSEKPPFLGPWNTGTT
jgi:hypothetical protein